MGSRQERNILRSAMESVMDDAMLRLEGRTPDPTYSIRLKFGGLKCMHNFLNRELGERRGQTPIDTDGNPINLYGLINKFINPYMSSQADGKPREVEIKEIDYRHLGILAFGHKSWIDRDEKDALLGYVGNIGKQIEKAKERQRKSRRKYENRGPRFPKFW